MMPPVESHYLLPSSVPTAAVWLGAVLACAAWWATHLIPRPGRRPLRWLLAAGRTAVGFGAALAVAQAVQRVLLLTTDWPVWTIAAAAAGAVEAVVALYHLERRTVTRREGLALVSLRVLLVVLVLAMLAQPVRSVLWSERLPCHVAVLLDTSASMHVRDAYAPWEKVRLAEALGVPDISRPYRLEGVQAEFAILRDRLGVEIEWLDQLNRARPEARRRALGERRSALHDSLVQAAGQVQEQLNRLSPQPAGRLKLSPAALSAMEDVRAQLKVRGVDTLRDAAALIKPGASDDASPMVGRVLDAARKAQAALAELMPRIQGLGLTLDEALYAALPASQREKADAAANMQRADLARALLLSRGGAPADGKGASPLLDRLAKRYDLRTYELAASTVEANLAGGTGVWPVQEAKSVGPATAATRRSTTGETPVVPPAYAQQTNIAAALQKVLSDLPADRISGVLLLSDGRHNALGEDVDAIAQRMGAMGVKVSAVPIGSAGRPPTDAAVVSVDVPEVVFANDRMYVAAELKLDGLAGRKVKVALYDEDGREVDGNTILVPADAFRTRIQLADTPQKAGARSYRLALQRFDEEAFAGNNDCSFTVAVTDDRVRVLLIEGRPRWEFRYVKNLFAGRDKTVRLQYVLFEPDQIAGLPAAPEVVASAAAPEDRVEATALPGSLADWMKFDVIVLGDVAPQSLRPEDTDAIRRFVTDRGGTLIVISGPRFMPAGYFGTPLADVLPVTSQPAAAAPGGAEAFRLALTAEGREHVILRLAVDPKENDRLWESMPEIQSRLHGLRAKPGATALAYAMPTAAPAFLDPNSRTDPDEVRRFQNDNALLLEQPAGLGEVLMLTFDHTWRLRYQAGDLYHHKLWGQVLRWATANKLPSGTSFVKIGADRARYWPGQHVRIRARIVSQDLTPVKSDQVAVRVSQDGRLVGRKGMTYRPDSPGLYETDLGPLPSGQYRVELDAPAAKDILAAENATTVQTEFSVTASTPQEEIELSPDRGLLSSLAERTGGVVVDAPQMEEACRRFGPGEVVRQLRSEYAIWYRWPLLAVILLVATAEWILRKKVGLA